MTRTLATRLARAEAALARGPGGFVCAYSDQLADVLRSLGRPDDDEAVRQAQAELREDGPLQRSWLAAGHELAEIMVWLLPGDRDL